VILAVWVPSVTVRVPEVAVPLKVASPADLKAMSLRSSEVPPVLEKPAAVPDRPTRVMTIACRPTAF